LSIILLNLHDDEMNFWMSQYAHSLQVRKCCAAVRHSLACVALCMWGLSCSSEHAKCA